MKHTAIVENYFLEVVNLHWWESFFEGFGKVLGFAIIALAPEIKKQLNKLLKSKTNYFVKNINVRKQINDELNEIRLHMDADRAVIFEFSNTDKSISNFPFEYMTMTYERTNPNTKEIKDGYQKKHINQFVDFLQLFSGQDVHYKLLQTVDPNLPDNLSMRMEHFDIKTCLVFKLSSELRMGYIAVHFLTDSYLQSWDIENGMHKDHRFMKMKAMNILTLMKSLQ